ncbi:hypothetical protein [Bacteroides phage LoVEphage]|nr:hypothetical protein [Bacteroides phage LoVEphage]UBU95578.1 MAG: hypothetical protein [Bacteroides phage LoVEphage]
MHIYRKLTSISRFFPIFSPIMIPPLIPFFYCSDNQ